MRHAANTVKHGYKSLYAVKLENKKLLHVVCMVTLGYKTLYSIKALIQESIFDKAVMKESVCGITLIQNTISVKVGLINLYTVKLGYTCTRVYIW